MCSISMFTEIRHLNLRWIYSEAVPANLTDELLSVQGRLYGVGAGELEGIATGNGREEGPGGKKLR